VVERIMIVVAAGSSLRFGADKLMTEVAGRPLVAHTVAAVQPHAERCILVCREDQIPALEAEGLAVDLVPGGPSRTASEMAGLAAIGGPAALIGIHDGARPLVSDALIEELFSEARRHGGAVPVVPPATPLVLRSDFTQVEGAVIAQTPQVFAGESLLASYLRAARIEYEGHDTAEIVQRFGDITIKAVPGDPRNIKVTHPGDIDVVRQALEASRSGPR
jgi:2-C-methyl-D-erythritol 4-phosphate cytidylyltransferase